MFDIEYKGANTVVIATKKTRIVCDPKLSIVGLKDIAVKDSIVLATEDRFNTEDTSAKLIINGPGEYETADVSIRGVAALRHIDDKTAPKKATMYRIEIGDVRIAVLGNIDGSLSEAQLEELGVIDVLILPTGGNGYTLDATSAAQLARAIDAKTVIPVHYEDTSLHYEVPQDSLELFSKELGGELEQTTKYKVKNHSTLPATLTIIEVQRT